MSVTVVTKPKRLSYVYIQNPSQQSEKYEVTILIPKEDKSGDLEKIRSAIDKEIQRGISELWGNKKPAGLWNPLRDGDEVADDHPEYKGMYFIKCKSKDRPGVVDRDRSELFNLNEIYSGCWARVDLSLFAYNNNSKGVSAALNNIMKWKDDERFGGGRRSAETAFDDDYEDEDDMSDLL